MLLMRETHVSQAVHERRDSAVLPLSTKGRVVKTRSGGAGSTSGPVLAQVLFPYGVGVDVHSRFIQVCVLCKVGLEVERCEREFGVRWAELQEARRWVGTVLGAADETTLRYCIESTGTYHMPIILAWGGTPSIVNPLMAGPSRRKTDVLDARLLAQHSITGLWRPTFIPGESAQVLRVLWSARVEAQRRATAAVSRLGGMLLRFGHTMAAEQPLRSTAQREAVRALLAGTGSLSDYECPNGVPAAARVSLSRIADRIDEGIHATREAQKEAVEYVTTNFWRWGDGQADGKTVLDGLCTVPGVGIPTALCWLAEIVDPRRFSCSKQVAAYCGCDPSLKVSAGKVTDQVRRKGNARLHWALLNAAAHVLSDPKSAMGCWGRSIAGRHKRGGYRRAKGAVARRIGCALWHVQRLGRPWDATGYTFGGVPEVPWVPLPAMGLPPRVAKLLEPLGNSVDIVAALYSGRVVATPGLGEVAIAALKDWVAKNQFKVRPSGIDERKKHDGSKEKSGLASDRDGDQAHEAAGQAKGRRKSRARQPRRIGRRNDSEGGAVGNASVRAKRSRGRL